VIESFKDKDTEHIWMQLPIRKLPFSAQRLALRKMFMLSRASSVRDLQIPPGNRLEQLKGSRAGQYSVRINERWRLCFKWENGNAYEVEIVDYH